MTRAVLTAVVVGYKQTGTALQDFHDLESPQARASTGL
jgi:hypothetical protein